MGDAALKKIYLLVYRNKKTIVERSSDIWHTIFIGMFSVDVKYTGVINGTLHTIRKKIIDQILFFHSMEIEKGIAQESLLPVTNDGILFNKTVEGKYVVQWIKNMLNETYSICISQEICLHILGFFEGNTDKLKTVCHSAGDSSKFMSPETTEATARIFYETWNLFFPQIFVRGMQCALLELLDNKEGCMLIKRKGVNRFFSNNNYVFSLITDNILAIYISETLWKSMKEVHKM